MGGFSARGDQGSTSRNDRNGQRAQRGLLRWAGAFLALLFVSLFVSPSAIARRAAAPQAHTEEDPLALVALLIRDGHWDRAQTVLAGIGVQGVDGGRYYTLQGLIFLRQQEPERAAESLVLAREHGEHGPFVGLYLAQALLDLDRAPEALAALEEGWETAQSLAAAWLLRAEAAKRAHLPEEAFVALGEGGDRFPERAEAFRLRQVLLLVELRLYQSAVDQGRQLLATTDSPRAWATVGEALRRAGQPEEAARLLEEARLRFPEDPNLVLRLAAALVDAELPLAAGVLLEREALLRPELALEAAECFRRAGQLTRALSTNARVTEAEARYRQRLGLLLEAEDFQRAAALEPRLSRVGLLREDPVVYAMAYARFRIGDLEGAGELLGRISDPEVFEQATRLREAMSRSAG